MRDEIDELVDWQLEESPAARIQGRVRESLVGGYCYQLPPYALPQRGADE